MRLLEIVASLSLPDCWIGAGFIRNAVWNSLHGRPVSPPDGDVHVIWFDHDRRAESVDFAIEERLRTIDDTVSWSVKNQVRVHVRNCDQPYASSLDALRFWPDTATAARRRNAGQLEVAAPHGLDDLFAPSDPRSTSWARNVLSLTSAFVTSDGSSGGPLCALNANSRQQLAKKRLSASTNLCTPASKPSPISINRCNSASLRRQ